MKPISFRHFALLILCMATPLLASPGDADNDGLRDEVETATGVFVSPTDTGSSPSLSDTDGDSLPDGMELTLGTSPVNAASKVKRPNIIYILADDLGYGDVGCFWQNQRSGTLKFATPGLDAMASEGAMMTHHYGGPICSASRSSFLLGQHQGHSEIRDNQLDKALPNTHNIASVLKSAGYRTIHVGKAGLAGTLTSPLQSSAGLAAHPLKRGFDRFFGYLRHDDGHEHYPRNGLGTSLAAIHNDYTPITDAHVDLFTGDAFTGFAKNSIIEETTSHPERPFFLYLSYDTPHFRGTYCPTAVYPPGSGLTGGIQWTGSPSYVNTATNDPAKVNNPDLKHPSVPSSWYPGAKQYVSLVRRIDDSVSDILQTLRDLGIDDNTLVVFSSDNGPAPQEVYPPTFESYGPFEGIKTDLWEGGIRVPTIAWWPGTIQGTNSLLNIRKINNSSINYDWMATFADLAKVPSPALTDGVSLLPTLTGQGIQKDKGFLYFEFSYGATTGRLPEWPNHGGDPHDYMQAIRIGDYMGVRVGITSAADPFRIYNVVSDPKQGIDVSPSRPDLQSRMKSLGVGARRKGAGLNRPYDTALIPAVTQQASAGGLNYRCYEGYWPWLPEFQDLTQVSTGQTPTINPAVRSREKDFGLSFTGFISVPTAGAYTFSMTSSSSANLWIHEGLVIDNDYNFTPTITSTPVYLAAGLHPIKVYYRHQTGTPSLALSYSGPGIPMQAVPASALFNDGPIPVFQLQPDRTVARRNTQDLVDVLANDTANYPLSLVSAGPSSSGSLSLVSGKVAFQPSVGFVGSDSFSYSVTGGVASASSTITANVLFDDEVWIACDEGSGSSVNGVGPSLSIVGTLAGTSTPDSSWTSGRFGKALRFDGDDDQVNFPDLVLPGGSSPRTFSCWMRTSNTTSGEIQTLFSYGGQTPGGLFAVRVHNIPGVSGNHPARLEVFNGTVIGTKPLNDGLWHHLAIVLEDTNNNSSLNVSETKLYVDGVADPISTTLPVVINTGNALVPCAGGSNHATNHHFNGDIDDIRIFPRALSALEIAELKNTEVNLVTGPQDVDGDGATATEEAIAGTNPNDPRSVFKILSTGTSGSNMVIRWSAMEGKTYGVEQSTNLQEWTPVPGQAPYVSQTANPNASIEIPANGESPRFFRLSVK